MIKGISRQIIEVTDTGSEYYDRALLMLKPEYAEQERAILEKEAKKILKEMGIPSLMHKRHRFMYWLLRLVPAAVAGAGITALFMI